MSDDDPADADNDLDATNERYLATLAEQSELQ